MAGLEPFIWLSRVIIPDKVAAERKEAVVMFLFVSFGPVHLHR